MPQTKKTFSVDIESIARLLGGEKKVKDGWKCLCPCHDDSDASLTISPGKTQPWVVKCFAGCDSLTVFNRIVEMLPKEERPEKVVAGNFRRKAPSATYDYKRDNGDLWFQVLRFDKSDGKKDIRVRHQVNGEWVYKKPLDADGALYGLLKLNRLRGMVPVIVCEGEKNCDFLRELYGEEFIQVTNAGGAKAWTAAHGARLEGCEVIIAEDCDDPGRWRTRLIVESLPVTAKLLGVLRFSEEEVGGKGGDLQDWYESGKSKQELLDKLKFGLQKHDAVCVAGGNQKKEDASREQYLALYREIFGDIKRDLFTGVTLYKDEEGHWIPVSNYVDLVKSEALEKTRTTGFQYSMTGVDTNLAYLTRQLKPRVIPEFPEWDGKDRIRELAWALILKDGCGLSNDVVSELLAEWLANVWRKWRDPSMNSSPSREFIFILQGPQKIGKDYWLRSLLCSLGQWFSDLTLSQNERDNYMQLHENAVLNISEFDRTNRVESGMIKDLITKHSTKLRAAYGRDSQYRVSRCSLVASVNPADILRDSSGNSRYCIVPVVDIIRCYSKSVEESGQVLAQAKALADAGYTASKESWEAITRLIEEGTPQDPIEEIVEWWEDSITEYVEERRMQELSDDKWADTLASGYISKSDAFPILDRGCKSYRLTMRQMHMRLKAGGLQVRKGKNSDRMLLLRRDGQK